MKGYNETCNYENLKKVEFLRSSTRILQ